MADEPKRGTSVLTHSRSQDFRIIWVDSFTLNTLRADAMPLYNLTAIAHDFRFAEESFDVIRSGDFTVQVSAPQFKTEHARLDEVALRFSASLAQALVFLLLRNLPEQSVDEVRKFIDAGRPAPEYPPEEPR